MSKTIQGFITSLGENEVFVFGSNLGGRHGAGAARLALRWGAVMGNPSGIQGKTYAIPTKSNDIKRTLSINEIKPYADEFIEYAREHPEKTFLLTDVGCGLAGLVPSEIAPLFQEALNIQNIKIHVNFMEVLLKHSA